MVNLYSFVNEENMAKKMVELIEEDDIKKIRQYTMRDNNINNMLAIYVKYLKNELKFKKPEIRNKLDEFMDKYYPKFCMADWDTKLEAIVVKYTKPHKREYKKPKQIQITKQELENIQNIKEIEGYKKFEIQKVLYVMLILAKSNYNGNGFWVNGYKSSDIFELARYKYNTNKKRVEQRERLFGLLEENGLIELSLYNSNMKLLYCQDKKVDKKSELKEVKPWGEEIWKEVITKVYDYNKEEIEINEHYDNITGQNMILSYINYYREEFKNKGKHFCVCCGKEIKKNTTNIAKYCTKCKKEITNKQKLDSFYRRIDNE